MVVGCGTMSFKQGQWDRLLSVSTILTMHEPEGWIRLMWKNGTEEEAGIDKGQRRGGEYVREAQR